MVGLGIDPGIQNIGYAIYDGSTWKLGQVDLSGAGTFASTLDKFDAWVSSVVTTFPLDLIAIELLYGGQPSVASYTAAEVGITALHANRKGSLKVAQVRPQTHYKFMHGRGTIKTKEDLNHFTEKVSRFVGVGHTIHSLCAASMLLTSWAVLKGRAAPQIKKGVTWLI